MSEFDLAAGSSLELADSDLIDSLAFGLELISFS